MLTKTSKKIVKFLLAGILGMATLFVPLKDMTHSVPTTQIAVVFAADPGPGESVDKDGNIYKDGKIIGKMDMAGNITYITDSQKEFAETLEIILKVIYLLLWPFLALAGLALDNGMVYGTYFQLDAALFTFWNIIKNFANFALGFLFLWSILKYIFNFGSKATNPMSMITKLLIAGIGIQASWFVIGALIDVSTVATVGIGGLPLQMLGQEKVGQKPLFGIKTNMKISDIGNSLNSENGFVILYSYPTTPDQYYLPCVVVNKKLLADTAWRDSYGIKNDTDKVGKGDVAWNQINKDFCIFGNDIMSFSEAGTKDIQAGSPELKSILINSQSKFLTDNKCESTNKNLCQNISNIANKGKGYQGAFYSLYGSLLNLGSIHVNVHKSNGSMTMEALIKAMIGIAYLIPLLVLCVVLIIRIAVLWITIAFSPILVLSEVFGFKLGDMEKYSIKNAISMIFLPVIATFAISISIVFLSVLSEGMTKGDNLEAVGMNTFVDGDKTCINLVVTTLCIDNPAQDVGVSGMIDFFPWLILNIFGIGLMWTILMATMKSTKFTGGIVDSVDKFAKNMVTTANIIPLGGGTSIAAVRNAGRSISGEIDAAASNNARTVVSPYLENALQKNFSGRVPKGQQQMEAATKNITSVSQAGTEVKKLVTNNEGALYNVPNASGMINNKTNNLDLSQFGTQGLQLVNKIATQGKLKEYSSVEDAFKDKDFVRLLFSAGLTGETIKSFYSGRDDRDTRHKDIMEIIDDVETEHKITQGTIKDNTFTTVDGVEYKLLEDGFEEKNKDGKITKHTKPEDWDKLLSTMNKETIKKMRDAKKVTPNKTLNEWIDKDVAKKDEKKDQKKPEPAATTPATTTAAPVATPTTNPSATSTSTATTTGANTGTPAATNTPTTNPANTTTNNNQSNTNTPTTNPTQGTNPPTTSN